MWSSPNIRLARLSSRRCHFVHSVHAAPVGSWWHKTRRCESRGWQGPAPTRHRRPAPARPVLRARSHRSVPRARVPAGTDRWPTSTRRRNSVANPECGCGAMHKAAANAASLGPTPIQRQCRHRGAGARPRCSPRPSGAATGRRRRGTSRQRPSDVRPSCRHAGAGRGVDVEWLSLSTGSLRRMRQRRNAQGRPDPRSAGPPARRTVRRGDPNPTWFVTWSRAPTLMSGSWP